MKNRNSEELYLLEEGVAEETHGEKRFEASYNEAQTR